MQELDIVILAAGKGTRMQSQTPKVLHTLAGKPMVQHVMDTASGLQPDRTHVVIGHGAEQLREALADKAVQFAVQAEQKGTGHAVAQALDQLGSGCRGLIQVGERQWLCGRRETSQGPLIEL